MDEKELIRSKVDMIELVGQTVELKRSGANWKGLCPFHHEKSPSFMVNPEMGIFKCFGCGEGGDSFSWMMKIEGLSFNEALVVLAEKTGVVLQKLQPTQEDRLRGRILEVLVAAMDFYSYLLLHHPVGEKARDYIYGRGITEEALQTFGLGYAPREWDALQRVLRKKGFSLEEMAGAGLIKKGQRDWYDAFRGRLMFVLKNARGQVVGFAGRILEVEDKGPKYINSPETVVYHKGSLLYGLEVTKGAIRSAGRVVLVEGELDAISSWQVGVKEVVAIKGTALTEEQIQILKRYTNVLVLALDMDMAGDKAARRGWQMAESAGMEVRVVRLPVGQDPDEMARTDPARWRALVDEAVEVYRFLLDSAAARYDLGTAHGKRKLVEELLPVWQGIGNEILRSHWVSEMARVVEVDEAVVWSQVKAKSWEPVEKQSLKMNLQGRDDKEVSESSKRSYWERQLVGGLLRLGIERVTEEKMTQLWRLPWVLELREWLVSRTLINESDWKIGLPVELQDKVGEVLLQVSEIPDEDEIERWVKNIEIEDLKYAKEKLVHEIANAEIQGDDQKLLEYQQSLGEVLMKIRDLEREGSGGGGV